MWIFSRLPRAPWEVLVPATVAASSRSAYFAATVSTSREFSRGRPRPGCWGSRPPLDHLGYAVAQGLDDAVPGLLALAPKLELVHAKRLPERHRDPAGTNQGAPARHRPVGALDEDRHHRHPVMFQQ